MENLPDDFPENSYLAEFKMVSNNKSMITIKAFLDIMFTVWTTLKQFKNVKT